MSSDPPPVGVVTAGGESRRMGRDKTALPLPAVPGMTLLDWAVERISAVCDERVVADAGRGLCADEESVADGPGAGPAAGILGAAARFPGRPLLVLACDLPLVPVAYLQRLADEDADWAVPETARGLEPLCALYGPRILDRLRRRVEQGRRSLVDLADGDPSLRIRRIPSRELWMSPTGEPPATAGGPDDAFVNLNRPEDLAQLDVAALRQAHRAHFLRVGSTRG